MIWLRLLLTARVSNGDEQNYVDKLRASPGYIPKLVLVAEEEGKLVGYIMLTKTYIAHGGSKVEALLIAPLSVALQYRNRGVGSKLVAASFEVAKKLGYTSVFVVGDPAYYSRFGFVPSVQFGIKHVPEIPAPNVMAKELLPNALADAAGTVSFI